MNDKKQILVADDDTDFLELISTRCKAMGLDVITSHDAMDALANADFYAPDIALLDVRMPGGNGISVTEMMATDNRLSATSVIVMTGDPNPNIAQRCHEMGAQLIKKDQQIWTRLQPILKKLIESDRPQTANVLEDFVEPIDRGQGDAETSALAILENWGWMNKSGDAENETEQTDDETPWILAIDDDPDFSLGLQKRLLQIGVRLVRAFRGMDGYRNAFRGLPAAILLDYQMPDGDGEYVLRRLKESSATDSVPIIVVTGMGDASLKRRMLAGGASAFLNKPVTWEQISRVLAQYTDLDLHSTIVPQQQKCLVESGN